ncbi:MAG: hypothetical protein ACRDOL_41950, partial [Streptosporangiaceae bacterium]
FLALPAGPARWPCPLALPAGPARWPCPLALPAGPARWPCPLAGKQDRYTEISVSMPICVTRDQGPWRGLQ